MLEVNDVDVFYGVFQALWGVSLKVHDHETVSLFGPNGHGKTTILRTISGILTPWRGDIKFDGKDISKMPSHEIVKMGIVQVPQGRRLFPEMTVIENLKLGAYISDAWKKKEENLERVYQLFPRLKERKNQKCKTLSGGERQMVAIGRSLMSSARLLMLDEPSLGLAPKLLLELMEKIKKIKETGISVILVDQNIRYITALTDRMYLIENGKVALEGRKEDMFENEYVRKTYLGKPG
jgi:branched-chain amino acid transport system ATP-binding protein